MLVQHPVIVFVWKPSFSTQSPAPMITQGMPLMPEHNRRSFPRIQPHSKLLIWIDSKEQQRSSLLLDICGFYLIVVRSQLHLPGSYWNQMNRLYIIGVVLFAMMIRSTSAVVMFASTGSIQQEGNAMADIARAIPGLTTLSGMVWYTLRACSMPNLWSLISMMWHDTMRYMRWHDMIWYSLSIFDMIDFICRYFILFSSFRFYLTRRNLVQYISRGFDIIWNKMM